MCRLVIDGMRERRFGRIVNIGSINGQAGQYGQVNYAAAKSGIHGFTKALAQEGASKGVTVNAIAPGYIDTDMVAAVPPNVLEKIVARIPVGRLGKASEIARAVLFLVADEGGFITGSTLSAIAASGNVGALSSTTTTGATAKRLPRRSAMSNAPTTSAEPARPAEIAMSSHWLCGEYVAAGYNLAKVNSRDQAVDPPLNQSVWLVCALANDHK